MKKTWGIAIAAGVLVVAGLSGTASARGGDGVREVRIQDRCDPATFNADPPVGPGLGPNTCVYGRGTNQRGLTTFGDFFALVNPVDNGDDHWRFNPDNRDVKVGEKLTFAVHNEGGEFHTFTLASDPNSGGCIPPIFLGLQKPPSPECEPTFVPAPGADPIPVEFTISGVPSGGDLMVEVPTDTAGTVTYMCLIHPWMQTVVTVS